jgi:hypothetical protein
MRKKRRISKVYSSFFYPVFGLSARPGSKQKVVHWLYTGVVRPYAYVCRNCVVAERWSVHSRAEAVLCITGPVRTAPAAAVEVLICLHLPFT